MMKHLQKLGSALMLPVATLPICGILMGLGYLLCPAYMMGGDWAASLGYATSGLAYSIGFFLIKAGGALIDNMAILYAIGTADARRLMALMKLAAKQGMELTVTVDGADEEKAAAELQAFLSANL